MLIEAETMSDRSLKRQRVPRIRERVDRVLEGRDAQKLAFKPTVTIPPFACFDSLPK